MNLEIWNDKRKLKEIKKIASRYGIKLTSSLALSICILLTNTSSTNKAEKQEQNDLVSSNVAERRVRTIQPTTSVELLAYKKVPLTYEEKVEKILDTFELTSEELDVCCAIAVAEACCAGYDYEEATNVINTAYNRIISAKWVASLGDNLYDQMTSPNQFVVYQNGSYLKYLGRSDLPGYQAVIDFLSNTNEIEPHSYLSFRSNGTRLEGSVELVPGGNRYFSLLTSDDLLEDFRIQESGLKRVYLKF